ncbi:gfo/Idh/MocA family oxidoreductase [candidate division KSB1 bacterium]|nr:gfo/Idh/MocA family oxidoreductase [candidate division KSB1 bacterium]
MVGGGQGAFIGGVHRMAAALDQQIDFVAGCFSRDFENTEITGKELYIDPNRCYRTYQEMAEKEVQLPENERIDFVSVVTPNASHHAICKAFLEAGIHVVCDKPMTCTVEEAEDLVRLVEETGLVFALTHNYTGHPMVRHARKLFRSGEMGEIRKVIVQYLQDFLAYPHEKEGQKQALWRVDPQQSGLVGTMGDCGTHAENLLQYITGEDISELCADFSTFLPDRELEEDANVLIRLKGGGKGLITVSQIATGEENNLRIKIYASKGAIIWEQENPNYLPLYRYGKPREILTRASGYLSEDAAHATRIPTGHPEGYLEAFANIYVGIVKAIRSHLGGNPMKIDEYDFSTVYDGLRGVQFVTRAAESAKKGSAWIKV